jgi:hypothetical protein
MLLRTPSTRTLLHMKRNVPLAVIDEHAPAVTITATTNTIAVGTIDGSKEENCQLRRDSRNNTRKNEQ